MMKRSLTLLLLIAITALLFNSCKNSKTIGKRLDGTWTVASVTVDGKELTGADKPTEMKFVSCQSGVFDIFMYCKGTLFYDNDSEEFDWFVSEKGRQIELSFYNSYDLGGTYEIAEDNKKHFEFISFDGKVEIVLDK